MISKNARPWIMATILALAVTSAAHADTGGVASVKEQADGIVLQMEQGTLQLQVWGEGTVRVHYVGQGEVGNGKSILVVGKPEQVKWTHASAGGMESLKLPKLEVRVNKKTGVMTFLDAAGKPITSEIEKHGMLVDGPRAEAAFKVNYNEAIYGLGQHQAGLMNYHGSTVHLQQANTDVAVPMWVSSRGYGVLWDNASVTDVAVGTPLEIDSLRVSSEANGDKAGVDYYFMAGPEIEDVIRSYRTLTGPAPMLSEWAFGYWQCKERYKSQEELLNVAAEYRKRGIPLDGIIQDWQYWKMETWGSHQFDPARYPDPAVMMKQLHDEHVHMLISVWPKFDLGSANIEELEKAGAMYPQVIPYVYPVGKGKWYDAFNETGRKVYWGQISKQLLSLGLDGWWLDASEAELSGDWGEYRHFQTAAGPGAEVFNAYPLMHTTGVYEGQRQDAPDKRVMILTRSAYAGQQRNAAVTWSGDIRGDWETFRRQIPAGLNFSLSGLPYWNTDIGGFFGGKPADPNYRELFTRWFQFGAFCPMFRVHGTGSAKEMWQFDEPTQKILETYDRLRYRLMPYTYSVAWQVTNAGSSMMRPLIMDFRRDPLVANIGDQYLFGPAVMVNPVTQAHATSRNVYLPTGTSWINFWTGESTPGGTTLAADAPIETTPLFIRAGSILPMGPVVQYAGEKPDAPLEVRIYRGADGTFTLYEDEGDTYHYEKGQYETIPLSWNEKAGVFSIGKRTGTFPGMPEKHEFHIVLVAPHHGIGLNEEPGDAVVVYTGDETRVTLPAK